MFVDVDLEGFLDGYPKTLGRGDALIVRNGGGELRQVFLIKRTNELALVILDFQYRHHRLAKRRISGQSASTPDANNEMRGSY